MNIQVCLVTYNPDFERLKNCLSSLVNQNVRVEVIDNNSKNMKLFEERFDLKGVYFHFMEKNIGIAGAQNYFTNNLLFEETSHVLFSDQDTIFPIDFITEVHSEIGDYDILIPAYYNEHKSETAGIIVDSGNRLKRIDGSQNGRIVHGISSGQVVSHGCLRDVGDFLEKFFIDWVDTEWNWRAYCLGKKLRYSSNILLSHELGDSHKHLFFGLIGLTERSDTRRIYNISNGLALAFYSRYPLRFRWYALCVSCNAIFNTVYSKRIASISLVLRPAFLRLKGIRDVF